MAEGRVHSCPPTCERASAAASASESQPTRQQSSDQTESRVRLAGQAGSLLSSRWTLECSLAPLRLVRAALSFWGGQGTCWFDNVPLTHWLFGAGLTHRE